MREEKKSLEESYSKLKRLKNERTTFVEHFFKLSVDQFVQLCLVRALWMICR